MYKPNYNLEIVSHYAILWKEYTHIPLQNTATMGV